MKFEVWKSMKCEVSNSINKITQIILINDKKLLHPFYHLK
jgi:hypothetical protein